MCAMCLHAHISAWQTARVLELCRLEAKYPGASAEQIAGMMAEIEKSLTGDACQSYAFSALGYYV